MAQSVCEAPRGPGEIALAGPAHPVDQLGQSGSPCWEFQPRTRGKGLPRTRGGLRGASAHPQPVSPLWEWAQWRQDLGGPLSRCRPPVCGNQEPRGRPAAGRTPWHTGHVGVGAVRARGPLPRPAVLLSGHCRARLACPVPSTPAGPRPGVCSGPRPSWGAAHTPPPLTAHAAPPWHAIALHTPVLQTCRAAHCSDAGARACGAHAQAASHTRTRVCTHRAVRGPGVLTQPRGTHMNTCDAHGTGHAKGPGPGSGPTRSGTLRPNTSHPRHTHAHAVLAGAWPRCLRAQPGHPGTTARGHQLADEGPGAPGAPLQGLRGRCPSDGWAHGAQAELGLPVGGALGAPRPGPLWESRSS